jgi:hypothetical protein
MFLITCHCCLLADVASSRSSSRPGRFVMLNVTAVLYWSSNLQNHQESKGQQNPSSLYSQVGNQLLEIRPDFKPHGILSVYTSICPRSWWNRLLSQTCNLSPHI